MTDIKDFLLDRIAEKEQEAVAAQAEQPTPWEVEEASHHLYDFMVVNSRESYNREPILAGGHDYGASGTEEVVTFLAHNDPAHVIAQCKALRSIVESEETTFTIDYGITFHTSESGEKVEVSYNRYQSKVISTEEFYQRFAKENPPSLTLRALAAVYKDHPEYQKEWAL